MVKKILCLLSLSILVLGCEKREPLVVTALPDIVIKEIIIFENWQHYFGPCGCPYHMARDGSRCGKRSSYSKNGGYPACYPNEVGDEEIIAFRLRHGITKGYYFGSEKEWENQLEKIKDDDIAKSVRTRNIFLDRIRPVYGEGKTEYRHYNYPFDKYYFCCREQ